MDMNQAYALALRHNTQEFMRAKANPNYSPQYKTLWDFL